LKIKVASVYISESSGPDLAAITDTRGRGECEREKDLLTIEEKEAGGSANLN
jgi:hypothetical protein